MPLEIKTLRLCIRPFKKGDFDAYYALMSQTSTGEFDAWEPFSETEAKTAFQDILSKDTPNTDDWNEWAVELVEQKYAIGMISLKMDSSPNREFEIGFHFNDQFTGKGFASEAVTEILHWAIHNGAHRVCARVDPMNIRSIKLFERVGMKKEGHLRENCFQKGKWCDELVYGFLKSDKLLYEPHVNLTGIFS